MTVQPESRIASLGLIVSNLARLEDFYCGGLGFEALGAPAADPSLASVLGLADRHVRTLGLRLGRQIVETTAIDPGGAPYPAGGSAHDPWFQHMAIVVEEMDDAYRRLARFPMTPISREGPQRLPPASGGVTAFKFRDPDGHPLELLEFPPGSRDRKVTGIDHTAIVVGDTERSVAFYTNLGMRVVHRSVNHGSEQQRLDDIAHVEVWVTALRPSDPASAGLELLEYRSVTDRFHPIVPSPADIVATRITLELTALTDIAATIPAQNLVHIESGLAVLRDPDNHLIVCSDMQATGAR